MGTRVYTTTNVEDNRGVADGQSQVATAGGITAKDNAVTITGGSNINLTDGGATRAALQFADSSTNNVLSFADKAQAQAVKFATDSSSTLNRSIEQTLGVVGQALDKSAKSEQNAISAVSAAYADVKGGNNSASKISLAIVGAVVLIGFFYFKGK